MTLTPHILTPADIMDLRQWRGSHGVSKDGGFSPASLDVPYLVCSASDGALFLHSQGRCVAGGLSPGVMCALLVNERIERGWVAQVADALLSPEDALRSPAARAEARARIDAIAARDRIATATEAAERHRRALHFKPADHSTLDLSDLVGTL